MDGHRPPQPLADVRWDAVAGSPDVVVVTVSGEIDLVTESLLRRAVIEAFDHPQTAAMVIDLSAVSFFSSAGIAVLAHAHEIAAEYAVALALVMQMGSAPDRSLTLLGLDQLWAVYPSRVAAFTAFHDAAAHRRPPHAEGSSRGDLLAV